MADVFSGWSWPTAVITALVLPILIALGVTIRKAILKWSRYAVDGYLYVLGKYITHRMASSLTLRRYATLQLGGRSGQLLVPAREDIILEMDKAYVPLTLEGPLEEKRYDHETIVKCGTRIRVIGEPGSGKSTILKRLFRDECQKCLRDSRSARFPILYELKHLHPPEGLAEEEMQVWFLELLKHELEKMDVFNMAECFSSFLSHAGLLVLLDGADEINSSLYPRAEHAIKEFSATLRRMSQNNVVIITMRKQFYQQTRRELADEFPHVLEAKPFSPSDIYRFLSVWPFRSHPQRQRTRIYADLIDRPTLRDMCANPLVLSMYVAEDQLSGHPLVPETRTDFYARVTDELLIRRRAAQVGAPTGALRIREERERFLGRLAFEHMLDETQPPNLIRWDDVVKVGREVFRCDRTVAEQRAREIASNTGLISEERPGETVRFIHLTFCEFLAALHSRRDRRAGWEELLAAYQTFRRSASSVGSSRLDQVIPFAVGLAPSYHAREDAIADVAKLDNMRLSALVFLETKQYDHPEWLKFCSNRRDNLLRSLEKEPDALWLEEVHLFAVVSKDFLAMVADSPPLRRVEAEIGLDGFFRQLGGAGKRALRRILRAYASNDPTAAFRIAALCNFDVIIEFPELIVENCDDPAVLALAVETANLEIDRISAWADVLAASALKSEVAARSLRDVSLGESWTEAIESVDLDTRWDRILGERSALSDVLSVSQSNHDQHLKLEQIEILRGLPKPSALLVERNMYRRLTSGLLLLSVVAAVSVVTAWEYYLDSVGLGSQIFGSTRSSEVTMAELLARDGSLWGFALISTFSVGGLVIGYGAIFVSLFLRAHTVVFNKYLAWLGGSTTLNQMVDRRKGSYGVVTRILSGELWWPLSDKMLLRLGERPKGEDRLGLRVGKFLRQAWHLLYVGRQGVK